MSLQTKFAVLLGLLGLIVLLALGTAVMSLEWTFREVRVPQVSMSNALQKLGDIKRVVGRQRDLIEEAAVARFIGAGSGEEGDQARRSALWWDRVAVQQGWEESTRLVKELEADELAAMQTGRSTFTNLRHRLAESAEMMAEWLNLRTEATLLSPPTSTHELNAISASASERLGLLYRLIERNETKVVSDTAVALNYAHDVRQWLRIVLALTALLATLACVLGFTLVRRWVLKPVAALRAAAARIGEGDFAYQIPIEAARAHTRDELRQLSTEVNQMAHLVRDMQDERVDRERLAAIGEMVRRLAHNLRNPLAGIRGLAELTRQELAAGLPPDLSVAELTENQQRIITTIDRFERWLSDLLNVTRPPRVQPERHEVRNWLAGVVETYRPMAEARSVTLRVDQSEAPAAAVYDPAHLEQALVAILSNAIEATAQASAPSVNPGQETRQDLLPSKTVLVTSRRLLAPSGVAAGTPPETTTSGSNGHPGYHTRPEGRTGPIWEISIRDQGPGIPAGLRDSIFKPYFTTKRDGNGIGLATSLQIVRAHEGSISVDPGLAQPLPVQEHLNRGISRESANQIGAVFRIRIPIGFDEIG